MFASTPEKKIAAVDKINTLKSRSTPEAMWRYFQREKNLEKEARNAEKEVKMLQVEINEFGT